MIVCPNCNHQNPEGATQCEACYTPLPATMSCPNCGASVQVDASFCGQCGFDLRQVASKPDPAIAATVAGGGTLPDVPDLQPDSESELESLQVELVEATEPIAAPATPPIPDAAEPAVTGSSATQLQGTTAALLHVQTDTTIELSPQLTVVHLGKPGGAVPPDIDVSGFPSSEIVSRVHADIRIEAGLYYLEDMGSSNGTYVNHIPLPPGNRHRLRPGDRIALGKEDKVTFI
ncbi:MAG: FHA domain-containing protein, partial [Spirulinaceae cyanobacterium RM2_2_10]|nr:FHA domain-containing protein [Spirulinaceae cyanobacterium RM2_2_10]